MTCIALDGPLPLLEYVTQIARAALASSPMGMLRPGEKVADLFCGAGGWGEGAKLLGITVDYAVNHDAIAIGTHRLNNPGCRHHQGDAWRTRPRDVIGPRTRLGILLASAACTTHSRARGAAPISKRVHMLGWCIARWMEEVAPRIVLIENVPEWQDWGPTVVGPDGVRRQDPTRKGQHFRRWWRYCQRLGYVMEKRVLDAPDYGEASRRKRLFIVARRDGQPIVWPEVTHGKEGDQGSTDPVRASGEVPHDAAANHGNPSWGHAEIEPGRRRCAQGQDRGTAGDRRQTQGLSPYRTAADVIDWSDLGTSIFERPRPLKPKTLARIAEGIRRHVLNDPAPFVLRVTQTGGNGKGWKVSPVSAAMPTQTARQDLAVATPVLAPQNTGVYGQRPDQPGPTITQKGHQSLITPVVQVIRGDQMGRSVKDPLPTVTAGNGPGRGAGAGHAMGLATPILATTGYGEREGQRARTAEVSELLGTCVNGAKQAVVTPLLMNNTTHHTGGRVESPVPTITTGVQGGLVAPVLTFYRHGGGQDGRVDDPVQAVTAGGAGGNHAMLVAALLTGYYGSNDGCARADRVLGTATTRDRHGLVCVVIDGVEFVIVDILFRMLRPAELARAMGFPEAFIWPRTQRDTVRLIGNAVSVRTARSLIGSVLPGGRAKRKAVRA